MAAPDTRSPDIQGQAASEQVRILIADDHQMVVDAIARLLERTGEFVTHAVGTLNDAILELGRAEYDLVMLDVRMPGITGLSSLEKLMAKAGDTKIVLFSGEADRRFVLGAVEMGVRGLIPKTMPLKALVSVIGLILSGQVFLPADVPAETPKSEVLTLQEKKILNLVADGQTNKQIALQINSNEVNVKMYMRIICKKLDAKNRAHATMIARSLAII